MLHACCWQVVLYCWFLRQQLPKMAGVAAAVGEIEAVADRMVTTYMTGMAAAEIILHPVRGTEALVVVATTGDTIVTVLFIVPIIAMDMATASDIIITQVIITALFTDLLTGIPILDHPLVLG